MYCYLLLLLLCDVLVQELSAGHLLEWNIMLFSPRGYILSHTSDGISSRDRPSAALKGINIFGPVPKADQSVSTSVKGDSLPQGPFFDVSSMHTPEPLHQVQFLMHLDYFHVGCEGEPLQRHELFKEEMQSCTFIIARAPS